MTKEIDFEITFSNNSKKIVRIPVEIDTTGDEIMTPKGTEIIHYHKFTGEIAIRDEKIKILENYIEKLEKRLDFYEK